MGTYSNGKVVPRRTLRPLNTAEKHSPVEDKKKEVFDEIIQRKYGTASAAPTKSNVKPEDWEEWSDPDSFAIKVPDIEDSVDSQGKLLNQQPAYDKMLHAEVQMQTENGTMQGTVLRRAMSPDGKIPGRYDNNPILNSLVYEVEFTDGSVREYSANLNAENMIAQCDEEGFLLSLMDCI